MYSEQFDIEEYYVEPEPEPSSFFKLVQFLRDILETVIPAALIAILINLFLAQATRVYGQSMEPSLHSDQRLVVEKLSYNSYIRQYFSFSSGPDRGDVVVVRVPAQNGELLIKRVIGLPGDHVEIHDGQVLVNGQILTEPYLLNPTFGSYGPITIPQSQIFVLGDNRNFSNDSRNFGTVPLNEVIGRAWFSYWPMDEIGFID
ncbi:signal peptidase I [Anaerolineales bacterium HSG6]|nr:signal peptidase I [Anaerolineales bacterium HSG6]MDM8530042.1 signal peptidase I [Anaerolineales bacterium HSG25]